MKNEHEVLFNQVKTYRNDVLSVVEDVSEYESEIIPQYFKNNIRWNLGHLYLDQFLWIETLTKEYSSITKNLMKWFGFGTSPDNFTSETPSFEELKYLLKQQPIEIENCYRHQLSKEYPPIEMEMYTIEQVLIRTIFHEGMHLQAIIDIKKHL
ncbi:DinB family protein [Oceanobacillus kimchii]|uniref:DinB family protein n=1 Tax=Oceanobacillus kimchii TaxID=746691 RepID=UPI00098790BE|nr:DinB family protein [Oceanobacillus kimchii]